MVRCFSLIGSFGFDSGFGFRVSGFSAWARERPITFITALPCGWPIYTNCMYDWLVVGAGFSGAVMAERIATRLGRAFWL